MAAEGVDAQVALAGAFCDVGRGVRQSIALCLRVEAGGFATACAAPREAAERDVDHERDEAAEGAEGAERAGWNEYERADYETPLHLTGDPARDDEIVREAVQAAVLRVRRSCDRGLKVLAKVEVRSSVRRALLAGAAPRALDDTS